MTTLFTIKLEKPKARNRFLVKGPLETKTNGSKKGKRGYNRQDKRWKQGE